MNGLFITFEGIEGVGKSTQIQRLAQTLRERRFNVLTLREPGGTPIGEEIRHTLKHSSANAKMTPEAELLLMNASRAQLVGEVIRPALQRGEIVLCDRFFDSTLAYQGYGRGLELNRVKAVIEFATGGLVPDLTLLLSLSVEASEARRARRADNAAPQRDRFEEADAAFFRRVAEGYRQLATESPQRIRVIDASKDLEEVQSTIWKVVSALTHPGRS